MKTYHAHYSRLHQTATLTAIPAHSSTPFNREVQVFKGTEKQFIAAVFQCKLKGVPVKIDIS